MTQTTPGESLRRRAARRAAFLFTRATTIVLELWVASTALAWAAGLAKPGAAFASPMYAAFRGSEALWAAMLALWGLVQVVATFVAARGHRAIVAAASALFWMAIAALIHRGHPASATDVLMAWWGLFGNAFVLWRHLYDALRDPSLRETTRRRRVYLAD